MSTSPRPWFAARARCVRAVFPILVAVVLPLLAAATPAGAQCGVSISGRFGGETTAVAQVGTSGLLVATGTTLEMLNTANANAPVSFSPPRRIALAAPARKISLAPDGLSAAVWLEDDTVVRVTILYVPLLNISNPVSLRLDDVTDILADGPRVYVAKLIEFFQAPRSIAGEIEIYDFSVNGNPVFVQRIRPLIANYGVDRIVKVGNILWAGIHEYNSSMLGVEGWNVSNPAAPVRVTTSLNFALLGSWTSISAMTAIGNKLVVSYDNYITFSPRGLDWMRTVDISNPGAPVWNPPVNLNGVAGCMSSTGNLLRISIKNSGVGTWDTANPAAALVYLGGYFDTFPQVGQMVSGAASGLTDYWAAGRGGLMTMNTFNPSAVSVRTNLTRLPVGPTVVRQSGNITAVLDYTFNTLRLYDYTLPESQQLRSSLLLPLYSELMEPGFLAGGVNILAIATKAPGVDNRITLINITNPSAPVTLPNPLTGFEVEHMCLTNSRLYVMTTAAEFKVIELSSLTPVLRSTTPFGGSRFDYRCMTSWEAGASKAVALGTNSFGLWLIDVTSATNPFVASVYNPAAGYRVDAVAKGDQQLYVSSRINDVGIFAWDAILESITVTTLTAPVRRFLASRSSGCGSATIFGLTNIFGPTGLFSAPGSFDSLTYVTSPAGKFLVGTTVSDPGVASVSERAVIFQISSFFALENFLAPIASQTLPYVTGGCAPSSNGSRILTAGGPAGLYQVAMPVTWAPGYVQQAFNQSSCYSGTAFINTLALANPTNVTFQWYRVDNAGTTPIADGPTGWGSTISGATQAGLTISNLRPNDRRYSYFCRTTNSCGSTDSFWARVSFCAGDFDCSGGPGGGQAGVTVQDIFSFLSAWFANDPRANFNGVNGIEVGDIFAFLSAWFARC